MHKGDTLNDKVPIYSNVAAAHLVNSLLKRFSIISNLYSFGGSWHISKTKRWTAATFMLIFKECLWALREEPESSWAHHDGDLNSAITSEGDYWGTYYFINHNKIPEVQKWQTSIWILLGYGLSNLYTFPLLLTLGMVVRQPLAWTSH